MADERTPEEILTGIANELKPDVDRLVSEIGAEQVRRNIDAGLARIRADSAARRAGKQPVRFDFRECTPEEARQALKAGLTEEPTATRKAYAALANKTWLLLKSEYTDEIRDWHVLINGARAFVRERDEAVVERLTALADLLGESITQFEINGKR
jgi:hypothetical protein